MRSTKSRAKSTEKLKPQANSHTQEMPTEKRDISPSVKDNEYLHSIHQTLKSFVDTNPVEGTINEINSPQRKSFIQQNKNLTTMYSKISRK